MVVYFVAGSKFRPNRLLRMARYQVIHDFHFFFFSVFFKILLERPEDRLVEADWDQFHCLLTEMLHRVPCMKDAVLLRLCNAPETFTPDNKYIVGEAPEVSIFFKASLLYFKKGEKLFRRFWNESCGNFMCWWCGGINCSLDC